MKPHKIVKKLRQLHLIGKITVEENGIISTSVKNNKLTDHDLKNLQNSFPRKKYDITIKTEGTDLILQISQIRFMRMVVVGNNHPPMWPRVRSEHRGFPPVFPGNFSSL